MTASRKEGDRSLRKSGSGRSGKEAGFVTSATRYTVPKSRFLALYTERDAGGKFVPVDVKGSGRKLLYVYSALRGASDAGLLSDSETQHVSIRVPKALLEAAKEETGISSNTELGILALSAVAQPDPVTAYMKRTRGRLGKEFELEY